jgi:hypothetical protein
MRWVDHVARMGRMRIAYKVWLEDVKRIGQFEDLDIAAKIILE